LRGFFKEKGVVLRRTSGDPEGPEETVEFHKRNYNI
jgi:hypothetical protein